MSEKSMDSAAVIAAMIGIGTYLVTLRKMYNNMTPSVHADESGAIGVIIFPFVMAGVAVVGTTFVAETISSIANRFK